MSLRSRMFVAVSFTCSVGCVSHGRVRSGVSVSEWGVLSTGSSLASISLSVVSGRVVWKVRLSVVSERSVGLGGVGHGVRVTGVISVALGLGTESIVAPVGVSLGVVVRVGGGSELGAVSSVSLRM